MLQEASHPLASTSLEAELFDGYARPAEPLSADTPLVAEPGQGAELVAQAHGVRAGEPLVLRRPLVPQLKREFQDLLKLPHSKRRLALVCENQLGALVAGLPEPQRTWIRSDVAALADGLRRLSGSPELFGSLYVSNHDHCRKFHSDAGGLRLLVTYAGPGTQLVVDQAAARPILAGRQKLPLDAFNSAVIRAGGVRQVEAGDVVLMRGNAGPGAPGRGVVHRSPPVGSAGLRRLLLKLDAPLSSSATLPSAPLKPLPALKALPADSEPWPSAPLKALPADGEPS